MQVAADQLAYTPDEFLALGVPIGRTSLYERLRDGTIPSIRVGKKYWIPRHAIQKFLAGEPKV